MQTVIIINEQHNLLDIQESQLKALSPDGWEVFSVPRDGLTAPEQRQAAQDLWDAFTNIVFVSPVPLLLAEVAHLKGIEYTVGGDHRVFLFVNDRREKKTLPDGRVFSVLPLNGWRLEEL